MARPSDAAKDRELIRILTENARLPLSEIAKQLGVSRATAQGRLSRLERDGVIAGYTTILGKASRPATTRGKWPPSTCSSVARRKLASASSFRPRSASTSPR